MEPLTCTTSSPIDDGGLLIKVEPEDDGSPTALCSNQSEVQLSYHQHLSDPNYSELKDSKNDIRIINITPITTNDNCDSKPNGDNLTVKSEHDDNHISTQTTVKCEVVPNLYEVKSESQCTSYTELVRNNIDAGSELVEVPGEVDCKPEIVDHVYNVVVPCDVNIQTGMHYNDTVNQKTSISMKNCEVDAKEEIDFGK